MLIDSVKQAFLLPDKKKKSFADIRNYILSQKQVSIRTMQRFTGKCVSFIVAITAAKLFTGESNSAIEKAIKIVNLFG